MSNKLKAFSLIELSISLLIIGIILGSVFKGTQLLENVKIQSVAKQFQEIRLDIEYYVTRYGEFPGNTVYTSLNDTQTALQKLHEKGITRSHRPIKSKFGGVFRFKTIEGKHYVQLVSDMGGALLNQKQIEYLKTLVDTENVIMDGSVMSYLLSDC